MSLRKLSLQSIDGNVALESLWQVTLLPLLREPLKGLARMRHVKKPGRDERRQRGSELTFAPSCQRLTNNTLKSLRMGKRHERNQTHTLPGLPRRL